MINWNIPNPMMPHMDQNSQKIKHKINAPFCHEENCFFENHQDAIFFKDASPGPMTAKNVWKYIENMWPNVLGQDHVLTSIDSGQNIYPDGTSHCWVFDLDLLDRQGKATVYWNLIWDGEKSKWIGAHIKITASPYPLLGSPVHRLVSMGYGSVRLLDGAWKQMRDQSADVPQQFIDSSQAIKKMVEMGLNVLDWGGSLWTQQDHGVLYWVCQSRDPKRTMFKIDMRTGQPHHQKEQSLADLMS